jgi:hypothetical protein
LRADRFARSCVPAAYRREFTPKSFLKTHAITAAVNEPWSPRAFQKISGANTQRSPLANSIGNPFNSRLMASSCILVSS